MHTHPVGGVTNGKKLNIDKFLATNDLNRGIKDKSFAKTDKSKIRNINNRKEIL